MIPKLKYDSQILNVVNAGVRLSNSFWSTFRPHFENKITILYSLLKTLQWKIWTPKYPREKYFGPTKYTRENILDPQNTLKVIF